MAVPMKLFDCCETHLVTQKLPIVPHTPDKPSCNILLCVSLLVSVEMVIGKIAIGPGICKIYM